MKRKISPVFHFILLFILLSTISCSVVHLSPSTRDQSRLEIHVINVGYGEAILIKAPGNRSLLWDGGYPEKGELVCTYLMSQNVQHLDIVVNSHPHPDHIGGLPTVIKAFPVSEIWASHPLNSSEIPAAFRDSVNEKHIPYRVVRQGYCQQWTKTITLEILNPIHLGPDLNDSSLVCRLGFGKTTILLTADIGPAIQKDLLATYNQSLKSAFMTIPHHGGRSFLPFFQHVQPEHVTLSVGPNPWGNPKKETLEFLHHMGLIIHRTDELGSIVFACDNLGQITRIIDERDEQPQ